MAGDYLHGIRSEFLGGNDKPIELLDVSIGGMVGTGAGADADMFPLNKAVLVNRKSQIAKIGDGTLKQALLETWEQSPAIVTVVRVEDDDDENTLKANIIGTLDNDTGRMTGMKALMVAEKTAGKKPYILMAPGFQDPDIAAALESTANKMNATPIVEANGTGLASNKAFTEKLGHAFVIAGGAEYFDSGSAKVVVSGGSATAYGVMVKTDNTKGFAKSPSNEKAYTIRGPELDIDYVPGSVTCAANLYNSENMTVFIAKKGGTRLWGSRLANGKKFQKERVRLAIDETIRLETEDIVDENITKAFVDRVRERVQNFLDRMTLDGIISGGRCWIDAEDNIALIGTDKFYVNYAFGIYDQAEQVTYRYEIDLDYNKKVFE